MSTWQNANTAVMKLKNFVRTAVDVTVVANAGNKP